MLDLFLNYMKYLTAVFYIPFGLAFILNLFGHKLELDLFISFLLILMLTIIQVSIKLYEDKKCLKNIKKIKQKILIKKGL